MGVYDDIDKKTALDIINSLVNTDGAEIGITLSKEFLKSLLNALNDDEQNDCVKWHPYPEEKPPEMGWYLATLEFEEMEKFVGKIFWWGENKSVWDCCIAWAELPKPYEDKKG